MDEKKLLLVAQNTAEMLLANKLLKQNGIKTDMVPAPPQSGTICAIAIKIDSNDYQVSDDILKKNNITVGVYEDKIFKLKGLLDKKLNNSDSTRFINIIKKIEDGQELDKSDIKYILDTKDDKEIKIIYSIADKIRKEIVGDVVEIRGAIEFSNYCIKSCKYCGINSTISHINRYRMTEEEILDTVMNMKELGIKTVILQSGEDLTWTVQRLVNLIRQIKEKANMKITLSIGERTFKEYELLKDAGANNFLLKIETTNRKLFKKIHPDDDFDYRLQCSKWLKELGYINASGNIIGLPGQTTDDIADDILFFKEMGFNMIGIGPFIPAKGSRFEGYNHGSIELTLKTIALTRIVCQKVFIPSTTALASLDKDAQVMALNVGANSIMLISTPEKYRDNYMIYSGKNMIGIEEAVYAVNKAGRKLPSYIKV